MAEEKLSARRAFKDISFFWWLFGVIVGAPSIVSIVQSVFLDKPLITPLQWAQDRYDEALDVLGQLMEPFLVPLVQWVGNLFDWDLTLQPHWRPLFVLVMVSALPFVRDSWRERARSYAVWQFVLIGGFGLIGCLAAALLPRAGPWYVQGLITALPVATVIFSIALSFKAKFGEVIFVAALFAAMGFTLGAAASAIPLLASGPGLAGLGAGVLAFAVMWILEGRAMRNAGMIHLGLTMLGPFLGAGLIYALDWTVREAGWAG